MGKVLVYPDYQDAYDERLATEMGLNDLSYALVYEGNWVLSARSY